MFGFLITAVFQAFLVGVSFAIWRIAKRTGHGRFWDALMLLHAVSAFFLIPSVDKYDPIGPFCDPSYGANPTWARCAEAQVVSALGLFFFWMAFVLPLVLAFKKWPIDGKHT